MTSGTESLTVAQGHYETSDVVEVRPPRYSYRRKPLAGTLLPYGSPSRATTPSGQGSTAQSHFGGSGAPVLGMMKWEGRIVAIEDGVFTAELVPMEDDSATIFADFYTQYLGPDEQDVVPGDLVYYTVRTIRVNGYPYRTESLRLRRLGRWSEAELLEAKRRAAADWGNLDDFLE